MRPEIKKRIMIKNSRYKLSWYKNMVEILRNRKIKNFRKKSRIESY